MTFEMAAFFLVGMAAVWWRRLNRAGYLRAMVAQSFVTIPRHLPEEILDTGLKGKNVLITGASRNLGRLSALTFAREGANLAICAQRKGKELSEVAAEARSLGVKVVAELCDVTDQAAVRNFVGQARQQLGG